MSLYLWSQILAIVAIIALGCTYLQKNRLLILLLCIVYNIAYGGQFLLLGALTGVAVNVVSIIRNVWFYINTKKQKKNSVAVLITLLIITLIFTIITYQNIYSFLPMVAVMLYTYSVWQEDIKKYRLLALLIGILYLGYDFYCKSIFGVILELILFTFVIIGIFKDKKSNKIANNKV